MLHYPDAVSRDLDLSWKLYSICIRSAAETAVVLLRPIRFSCSC